jgi:shikimate dehydrogenase
MPSGVAGERSRVFTRQPLTLARRTVTFIGITTAQSSIHRIFSSWMAALGRPEVVLEGLDLRLHDEPATYRRVIERIKADPDALGGVVTSHKVDLFAAAHDLFDELNALATALGEISSITKSPRGLVGSARDPISVGQTLDALLGPGYFGRTGGEALCFGAGGSAASIAAHFARMRGEDRPARFVLVNRSQPRLDQVKTAVAGLDEGGTDPLAVVPIHNEDPARNDDLVASMPDYSLVINATGMGKDRPGSPITDGAVFPRRVIAWDLNYRGELLFLRQARAQASERELRVEDGWEYFVRGWAEHVAPVLDIDLTPELFERLAKLAAEATGR